SETGADYPLRVTLIKDHVVVALDTTGEGLHKRGYRQLTTKAPIEETLAAALIMLTPWKHDRILVDPFCGSGTFAIEAALMGLDIAPGISREFTSEKWSNLINRKMWFQAREEAEKRKKDAQGRTLSIYASDIDPKVLSLAKKNAEYAGVLKSIHFSCADAAELKPKGEYGFIITNPPYGVRL
ncbi:MAG: methyltransferase, partial [Lachnospiraceae bacterium]|nr:methyltransferase [Lachnospiraceae bacterium]